MRKGTVVHLPLSGFRAMFRRQNEVADATSTGLDGRTTAHPT
jgi:hypothetical protein